MPWKFVRDLWFHEVFTNNSVQADNIPFRYLPEDFCLLKLHETKGRRQTSMALNI